MRAFGLLAGIFATLVGPHVALAQGEDGTRAERNAQIIMSLLPGRFDNVNQVYFAKRLSDPEMERQTRTHIEIKRNADGDALVFAATSLDPDGVEKAGDRLLATFQPEADGRMVRMTFHRLVDGIRETLVGCDMLWELKGSQFRARRESGTCSEPTGMVPIELQLGENDLWWTLGDAGRRPLELERARMFSCYIDVPGVGGGRDIPYQRYEIDEIHDKGGERWVQLKDGSELAVRLTNVRWPMNNLNGIFTRHSFVVYLSERKNGEKREVAYSWTHPDAQRIGMNVKTALVNCFMLNNEEIEPFFREEPRL